MKAIVVVQWGRTNIGTSNLRAIKAPPSQLEQHAFALHRMHFQVLPNATTGCIVFGGGHLARKRSNLQCRSQLAVTFGELSSGHWPGHCIWVTVTLCSRLDIGQLEFSGAQTVWLTDPADNGNL